MGFQVIADPHPSASWDKLDPNVQSVAKFTDGIKDIKEFDPESSAVVIPGDFSQDGSEGEYKEELLIYSL